MIVNFDPITGQITKETSQLGPVSITVDDAREAWNAVGTIEDCNLAFSRLATEHEFDVAACLKWYEDNS